MRNSSAFQTDDTLLPNLLLIGANKAGTTSLHVYLSQHPEIFMSEIKEPMFFCNWVKKQPARNERDLKIAPYFFNDVKQYQELFLKGKGYKVRGESSTAYLTDPVCPAKIKLLVPAAKIIAVLRNPVDRAFSSYVMFSAWGFEKRTFRKAVHQEIKKGKPEYPHGMNYLFLGEYAEALKTYTRLFPPEQLKIYLYDDLQADPKNFVKSIFEFLEVDSSYVPDLTQKYNVSVTKSLKRYAGKPKIDRMLNLAQMGFNKLKIYRFEKMISNHRFYDPVFKEETREKLITYYADEISALEDLLGRDLSGWRK